VRETHEPAYVSLLLVGRSSSKQSTPLNCTNGNYNVKLQAGQEKEAKVLQARGIGFDVADWG
jgi:hypothetical protein